MTNFLSTNFSIIKKRFPFLHYISLLHVGATIVGLILMMVDDRQLVGVNVWVKPTKFLLSTFILLWTVGWYLNNFPFKERSKNIIAYSLTGLLFFENILISMQAARGVQSHYNETSLFDGIVFGLMGLAVALITLLMFWLLIKSFSPKLNFSNSKKWGFRLAWLALLFGTAIGGGAMLGQEAHSVGVNDGGSGIPFLNWSTEGGDYRIAHFLGLHAIQIIPIAIYFICKKLKNNNLSTYLSIGFALLYLTYVVFSFLQAKAGISFTSI